MRSYSVFVAAFFFFLFVCAVRSRGTEESKIKDLFNEKSTSAIFLRYVGDVFKPINPIFISSVKPSQKKLINFFGENVKKVGDIDQFIVDKTDLKNVIDEVRGELVIKSNVGLKMGERGKVEVGIVRDGDLTVQILSRDQLENISLIIRNESIEKYPDLYKAILRLRYRTGCVVGEKEKSIMYKR
jgi:hypothetical protein